MPAIDTTLDSHAGVVIVLAESATMGPPDAAVAVSTPTREKAAPTPPEQPAPRKTIRVWDRVVRSFHWLLVIGMASMIVSAHFGKQELHMVLGWIVLGLLTVRLVWGFIGSHHARFSSFVVSPFESLRYLGEVARGQPRHYLGHNPAGAAMVLALLGIVLMLTLSGLTLQATVEYDGPLAALFAQVDDNYPHEAFVLHKLATYALYLLVPLHILGVVMASRQHGENLILSMITGQKPAPTTGADFTIDAATPTQSRPFPPLES